MNNIVVPTNFTSNAHQHLQYAINLANRFGGTIHVVHVYQKERLNGIFSSKKEAKAKLEHSIQSFKRELYFTSSIKTMILEGSVSNQISIFSKTIDADLIIIGGAESWRETGMNNKIAAIIQKSRTSVLVVPNQYKYEPLRDIAIAIDKKIAIDDSEIQVLIKIAEGLKAKVQVLETTKNRILPCLEVGGKSWKGSYPFHIYQIENESMTIGIQQFITRRNTNLLCFINREYGLSSRFLNNLSSSPKSSTPLIPLLFLYSEHV